MTDHQYSESQRRALLTDLFGTEVPSGIEGQLLRTSDVAALFQVSERTVSEWARRGRIPSVRTPGGHRRYPADQIRLLLAESQDPEIADRRMAHITALPGSSAGLGPRAG